MDELISLPDFPAIKKLSSALFKFDSGQHGAAVMVGAGFSRSAATHVSNQKKMPLWDAFTKNLLKQLTPPGKQSRSSDALRIAEEYRAYFGQAALNDQIKLQIDDEAWRFGELHRDLLELPWSEVLTTNWDTLLERAAETIHGPYYTPVYRSSDLAAALSPRIAKLHGTIGVTDDFIVAQEDYRTYPRKYAPFVNFARQVFIENELCLIGFSGDDPNFLEWAGWIRDHLAGHSRKIYLVGALDVSAATRKHLESINIVPIDLWPAVKDIQDRDLRHKTAISYFLKALKQEDNSRVKPADWQPERIDSARGSAEEYQRIFKEPAFAANIVVGQLDALRVSRESYPGWLVCPPDIRSRLNSQIEHALLSPKVLPELNLAQREEFLYEVAWRAKVCASRLSLWVITALIESVLPAKDSRLGIRQRMEIALVVLHQMRWQYPKDDLSKSELSQKADLLISFLKSHSDYFPDSYAEIAYYQALTARDNWDYQALEGFIDAIVGEDPVWKMRRAFLLMEVGRPSEGAELISKVCGELRDRHKRDRHSIPILSRMAWAYWLLNRYTKNWTTSSEKMPTFAETVCREWKCHPWSWLDSIRNRVDDAFEKHLLSRSAITPRFGQGHYQVLPNNLRSEDGWSEYLFLEDISVTVGIPIWAHRGNWTVSLLTGIATKIVRAELIPEDLVHYALSIRASTSESSDAITSAFTRLGITRLGGEDAETLSVRLRKIVDYWYQKLISGSSEQRSVAITALKAPIEAAARLTVRLSPEKNIELFRMGVTMFAQPDIQHPWVRRVFSSLFDNCLKGIPSHLHGELLPDVLQLPLDDHDFRDWPSPTLSAVYPRVSYSRIDHLLDKLISSIDLANKNPRKNTLVLARLLCLVEAPNFLSKSERERIADGIWGHNPNYTHLPNTDYFPHAWLIFPSKERSRLASFISRSMYEPAPHILAEIAKELRTAPSQELFRATFHYSAIAHAAASPKVGMVPTSKQAEKLFDDLIMWRPFSSADEMTWISDERHGVAESICKALSLAIVPVLSLVQRNPERFSRLRTFYLEVSQTYALIPSFVYFGESMGYAACDEVIRQGLQRQDSNYVFYSIEALKKRAQLFNSVSSAKEDPAFRKIISVMVGVMQSYRTPVLQYVLAEGCWFVEHGCFTISELDALTELLPLIFDRFSYSKLNPLSEDAVFASSIREACVKIGRMVHKRTRGSPELEDMLLRAKNDPLPEVRFVAGG
ncbi:SIR2 family NAD-dependent protein deacylase [Herbaspirillum huttiense]|uniref:SIR2 family protein n=2 Tax=Herbaspirillum huttiense TaxID=863372 RepID=A0AAJ2HAW7_9BURK|nr:SIR2 family protein [Herbaspirillum huttiense]MDR9837854.1 SIR2 family protein [Herbaspirillum huttiense]